MLEPYALKGACTVLRGREVSNDLLLPDIGVEPPGEITPRESGLTSLGSSVTREPRLTDSGGQADMSAAEMLAGAAPGRAPDWKVWWTARRLRARIVKAVVKAAASREGRS